jgi:hypothetical protein
MVSGMRMRIIQAVMLSGACRFQNSIDSSGSARMESL